MNREKKSEFIRQSILTAAGELFAQNGFERTKVDDIAQKADLSKATFYAYFGSKEELLDTMLLAQLKDINRQTEGLIGKHLGTRNCFLAICNMFLSVSRTNAVCFDRMLQFFGVKYDGSTPELYAKILAEAKTLNDTLYNAMKANRLTRLFPKEHPDKAVFYLWSSVMGLIIIARQKEALIGALYETPREEFLDFAFEQLYLSAADD